MSKLIIFRGPIGAGKTSLMQSLARILPDTSAIEIDALKRMFDSRASTDWRRKASFDTALYIAKYALASGRNVIAETHSKRPEQQECFSRLAQINPGLIYTSVLVTAPLDICIKRSKKRVVPGIGYAIDESMIKSYYHGLKPLPGEVVIDTTNITPGVGAQMIFESLMKKEEITVCAELLAM
jgi:predicted kinase